jgi:uncharacterized protein YkwD
MVSAVLLGLVFLGGALVASGPAEAAGGTTRTSTRAAVTMSASQFQARLVSRINHRRVNHGCRAFRANAALQLAAERHNALMAADRELSHRLSGEASLGTRATSAGYTHWRIVAENLAWGQSSPRAVFRAWVHSAGHRANLDNCRLRDLGLAVVIRSGRPWVTADFGRRRAA